jgi:hypothetical protein
MSDVILNGLTGSLSGVLSGLLLYPLENVRTNIQTSKESISTLAYIQDKIAKNGVAELYSGLHAFLVRNITNFGFYYLFFSFTKKKYVAVFKDLRIIHFIQISAIASALNTIINAPIWLMSTKMTLKQHGSLHDCAASIYKDEGLAGFFRGLTPSLVLIINPII